jgi:protein O-GlcNAc transferase
LFADIDIYLDCFPWSGHTMACMSLWMGVPVVTVSGNCHAGRMVASVLKSIGLEDMVAIDQESYVVIGSELAADRGRIEELRLGLRDIMGASSLRDEANFTREYEKRVLGAAGNRAPNG